MSNHKNSTLLKISFAISFLFLIFIYAEINKLNFANSVEHFFETLFGKKLAPFVIFIIGIMAISYLLYNLIKYIINRNIDINKIFKFDNIVEKNHPYKYNTFKNISNGKKAIIIITLLTIFGMIIHKDKNHESHSRNNNERYESQSLKCDYCGRFFYKNSGVQLTGHSEVFCSSSCATNWAWQHNIGINQ